MNKSLLIALPILAGITPHSLAQSGCGSMPTLSVGDTVFLNELPANPVTVEIDTAASGHQIIGPANRIGTLVGIRNNVLVNTYEIELGSPYRVTYRDGEGIGPNNLNAQCIEQNYTIVVSDFSEGTESWSVTDTISHEMSKEVAFTFGLEFSKSSFETGLTTAESWRESQAHSNSVTASVGTSVAVTVPAPTPPCHRYRVVPFHTAQDYNVAIIYRDVIYDLDLYVDRNGDGIIDQTPGRWSFTCGPNNGQATALARATVIVGGPYIDDLGATPITDQNCPCSGGNNDFDEDGIEDGDDWDMDGDGVGNQHDNDTDGDGTPNSRDYDDDNDGIPDGQDTDSTGPDEPDDIDGDGKPNDEDDDIDGDGKTNDIDEDDDGDGVYDVDDPDDNANGENDWTEVFNWVRNLINNIRDFVDQLV